MMTSRCFVSPSTSLLSHSSFFIFSPLQSTNNHLSPSACIYQHQPHHLRQPPASTISTSKTQKKSSLRRPRPKPIIHHKHQVKPASILPPPPKPFVLTSIAEDLSSTTSFQHDENDSFNNNLYISQPSSSSSSSSSTTSTVTTTNTTITNRLTTTTTTTKSSSIQYIQSNEEILKRVKQRKNFMSKFRHIILGKYAILKENRQCLKYKYSNIAMTRGIVIFADYLADLSVLDLFSDLYESTLSLKSFCFIFTGLSFGVYVADFITGLFHYFQIYNCISIFPYAHYENDVFHKLVNSCFLIIPFLSIAVSWASESNNLFIQSTLVSSLALIALAPILQNNTSRIIHVLRYIGILKKNKHTGWSQICGISDHLLIVCIHWIETVFIPKLNNLNKIK